MYDAGISQSELNKREWHSVGAGILLLSFGCSSGILSPGLAKRNLGKCGRMKIGEINSAKDVGQHWDWNAV